MLDDLCYEFLKVGLVLNPSKVKWTMNKHAKFASNTDSPTLVVSGVYLPPCTNFVCLGSVISDDLFETHAIEHRIQRAWMCFHKWASVLLSDAPLDCRLEFWSKVVSPSLLWGLETIRDQKHLHSFTKLTSCQRTQVVKMMKCKRRPVFDQQLESWTDYRIRSYSNAKKVIFKKGTCVLESLKQKKLGWAGHIARFGIQPREPHLLKHVAAWRCTSWWHSQVLFNDLNWNPIKHFAFGGRPRRWESQFSSNWLTTLAEIVDIGANS